METPLQDLESIGDEAAAQERARLLRARIEREITPLFRGALVVRLAEGEPAQATLAIAKEEASGLIITGVARANGLGRALLAPPLTGCCAPARRPCSSLKRGV